MKLLKTSIFPYQSIKIILNNYFTSFHIVCEKPHDTVESRDITTMRTPIGLVPIFRLPQGPTNLVAHMMKEMNKVLRECIPKKTMLFLDDIPMKRCAVEEKDETIDDRRCRKFVVDHIHDCEKILRKL